MDRQQARQSPNAFRCRIAYERCSHRYDLCAISAKFGDASCHHTVVCAKTSVSSISRRKLTVEFNPNKAITADAAAGITWLDLERIEERYLLAACADGGQCMSTWENIQRDKSPATSTLYTVGQIIPQCELTGNICTSAGSLAAFDVAQPSNGVDGNPAQHAAVFRVSSRCVTALRCVAKHQG